MGAQQKRETLDGLSQGDAVSERISAKRTVAEGITVVVSILLAFGIDASWDSFGQRRLEAEYRSALKVELEDAVGQVERTQRLRNHLDSRLAEFLSDAPLPADSLRALIGDAAFANNLQPPTAVLDDLVSTGRLQILRSREVREGLMALRHEFALVEQNEKRHHRFVDERFIPAVSEMLPLSGVLWTDPQSPRIHRATETDLDRLQQDAAFQNLMIERQRALQRGRAAIERTHRLLEELIAELEEPEE